MESTGNERNVALNFRERPARVRNDGARSSVRQRVLDGVMNALEDLDVLSWPRVDPPLSEAFDARDVSSAISSWSPVAGGGE
jgi:hypothetical protein